MASYLAPTYVPQFNPYTSTIPVELYGKLITDKQQAYNEGVQKVQSYIDNTTGLRVGRPEDQAYLQSKIADMKSKYEGLASADYSSQSVLQQAGQIASTVYNDPRVIKDVMSNAYYQDAVKQLDEAKKNGTYADSNAFLMQKSIGDWMSGGDNASLGKQSYIPYDKDMQKRQMDYMKSVHGTVYTDQTSPKDSNGNPIMYILQNNKRVYLTPDQVKNDLRAFYSTDARANQQFQIDTYYNANKMSDDDALMNLSEYGKQQLTEIDDSIKKLKELQKEEGESSNISKGYQQQIDQLEQNKILVAKQQSDDITNFQTDKIGVKSKIYQRNLMNTLAGRFSYNETTTQLVENPLWKAQLEERKFSALENYRQAALYLQRQKIAAAASKGKKGTADENLPYGGTFSNNQAADVKPYTIDDLRAERESAAANSLQEKADIVYKIYGDQSGLKKDTVSGKYLLDYSNVAALQDLGRKYEQIHQKYVNGEFDGSNKLIVDKFFSSTNKDYGVGSVDYWSRLNSDVKDMESDVKSGSIDQAYANVMKGRDYDMNQFVQGTNVTWGDVVKYTLAYQAGMNGVPSWSADKNQQVKNLAVNTMANGNGADESIFRFMGLLHLNSDLRGAINTEVPKLQEGYGELNKRANDYSKTLLRPQFVIDSSQDGFETVNSLIQNYANAQSQLPDGKNDSYKQWVDALSTINKGKNGKVKPTIVVDRTPTGSYTASLLGGDTFKPIEISESIAEKINPNFKTVSDPANELKWEIDRNARRGIGDYTDYHILPTTGDYQLQYRIRNTGSTGAPLYSLEVNYKPKGADVVNFTNIPGISQAEGDITAVMSAIRELQNPTFLNSLLSEVNANNQQ